MRLYLRHEQLSSLKDIKRKQDEQRIAKEIQKKCSPSGLDLQKLDTLHPIMRLIVRAVFIEARRKKLNIGIHMAVRTWKTQERLYSKGRKKVNNVWIVVDKKKIVTYAKPGKSWHNYALGVDLVFKTPSGKWSWAWKHDWYKLGEIGVKHGLQWGGNFTSITDLPHFQYHKGIRTTRDALAIYKKSGMEAVWGKIIC